MRMRVSIARPRIAVVSVTGGFWSYVSPLLDSIVGLLTSMDGIEPVLSLDVLKLLHISIWNILSQVRY